MSEVAIICRVKRIGVYIPRTGTANGRELEPVVPREDLPSLSVCAKHKRTIYFDGPDCPCCGMTEELWGKPE